MRALPSGPAPAAVSCRRSTYRQEVMSLAERPALRATQQSLCVHTFVVLRPFMRPVRLPFAMRSLHHSIDQPHAPACNNIKTCWCLPLISRQWCLRMVPSTVFCTLPARACSRLNVCVCLCQPDLQPTVGSVPAVSTMQPPYIWRLDLLVNIGGCLVRCKSDTCC